MPTHNDKRHACRSPYSTSCYMCLLRIENTCPGFTTQDKFGHASPSKHLNCPSWTHIPRRILVEKFSPSAASAMEEDQ